VLHERKARLAEGHAIMSSAQNDVSSAPGPSPRRGSARASGVGAELRDARALRGWDLEALAESLRIRASYLKAIEDGRVSELPGNAYALGFLRTYASALGLDPDDITRRFRAEVAEVNARTELTFPAPVPDRGVPAGVVVLLGLVLAVGAYVGWYSLADHAAAPNPVGPVPERLARLADPTALAPPHIVPAPSSAPKPAPAPASAPAAAPIAAMGGALGPKATPAVTASPSPAGAPAAIATAGKAPAAALASVSGAVAGPISPPAPNDAASPAAVPASSASMASNAALEAVSSLAPPANAAVRPAQPPGTITVLATAAAWIEVRDSTGAVVFTKLMQPGESWTVPRRAGLVLTTGNAGGTELLVDGRPAPPLGSPGMVVRDQPLDAALIKAGALPAQIAAAASGTPAYVPASVHASQSSDTTQ
jgi:cytoskeleton protein RodZ